MLCLDANELYGYKMSTFLPTGGFKWIDIKEFHSNKYSSNILNGSDLEIDHENPKELCKVHNNYCNNVVLKIYLNHKFQ